MQYFCDLQTKYTNKFERKPHGDRTKSWKMISCGRFSKWAKTKRWFSFAFCTWQRFRLEVVLIATELKIAFVSPCDVCHSIKERIQKKWNCCIYGNTMAYNGIRVMATRKNRKKRTYQHQSENTGAFFLVYLGMCQLLRFPGFYDWDSRGCSCQWLQDNLSCFANVQNSYLPHQLLHQLCGADFDMHVYTRCVSLVLFMSRLILKAIFQLWRKQQLSVLSWYFGSITVLLPLCTVNFKNMLTISILRGLFCSEFCKKSSTLCE